MSHEATARSAACLWTGFETYMASFKALTVRAPERFAARDWHGGSQDAIERLALYARVVAQVEAEIKAALGDDATYADAWVQVKSAFSVGLPFRYDAELAETFYNSVNRRFFMTRGADARMQFVTSVCEGLLRRPERALHRAYFSRNTHALCEEILGDLPFPLAWPGPRLDAQRIAERLDAFVAHLGGSPRLEVVEVLRPLFYRSRGAYVVGRARAGRHVFPLVLALRHGAEGVRVDAVLLDEDEVSIVFSFTRSYFHVEAEKPRDVVDFLRTVMPRKRLAELYISIGFNKHGKTELYRELMGHLAASDDRFEPAPGEPGMVMTVFTLPSFDIVFKIIRDAFPYPKRVNRRYVRARYDLVFRHDRVGRLVDAQEFEHLRIHRGRFAPELLDELLRVAGCAVSLQGEEVLIKHAYVERRLEPLNLYLQHADAEASREAVLEYGNAIKELVRANIFPGDIMLKNFGVTRHGRVVFYDYDELCLVTDLNFRAVPPARDFNEELYGETYYDVGDNDVFPEEFATFLGLEGALRDLYVQAHGDLFTVAFWQEWQQRLRAGEVADVLPYRPERRLERSRQAP